MPQHQTVRIGELMLLDQTFGMHDLMQAERERPWCQTNLGCRQTARSEIAGGDRLIDDIKGRLPQRRVRFNTGLSSRSRRGAPPHLGYCKLKQAKMLGAVANVHHVGNGVADERRVGKEWLSSRRSR